MKFFSSSVDIIFAAARFDTSPNQCKGPSEGSWTDPETRRLHGDGARKSVHILYGTGNAGHAHHAAGRTKYPGDNDSETMRSRICRRGLNLRGSLRLDPPAREQFGSGGAGLD